MNPLSQCRWKHLIGPAVILLAAAVAVAPQLAHGNSCGHDFDFHLTSWLDCLNSWRHGIFYPHWAPSANYGAGEPRFVFYPPLTWMLGAALGALLPWALVPVTLTYLLLAGTGLATRALARHALAEGAATLAGCAALFSGYALFTAYERTAFGELAGGFWTPLLLLFILQDRKPAASAIRRALDGSTVPLALVVAGCWLSNAPVGVMACYLLAAVAVVVALLAKSWAPAIRAAGATALGLGLSAFYLLPAAWEQRWVDIRQATTADPGNLIQNSWLFAHHADPALASHDTVLFKSSLIGTSMIALALVCLLAAWLRRSLPTVEQAHKVELSAPSIPSSLWYGWDTTTQLWSRINSRRWWIPLALVPFAILFLQLPISLPVWNALPKLQFLQFPWRWLVVLEAPMAIFFASTVWPRGSGRRWRYMAVAAACSIVFLAATAAAGHFFFQLCDDEDSVAGMLSTYQSGAGFAGTDEYEPPGAFDSLLPMGLPQACLVGDPLAQLGAPVNNADEDETAPVWSPAQSNCEATYFTAAQPGSLQPEHMRVTATTGHAGYLILRMRSYPAWRLTLNGHPVASLLQREDGLMAVPVSQGFVSLAIDWTATPDVVASRWLSCIAVLLLTCLCLLERKMSRGRLS